MVQLETWWRCAAGLLAACLVAMLAFGPALDLMICANDDAPVASASHSTLQSDRASLVASVDEHLATQAPSDHRSGVCPHGHSHQGESCAPTEVTLASLGVVAAARPPIPGVVMPASHDRFGLDRPPRA